MQLRRSLIELEDQNVQNSIEIGKRQVCMFAVSHSFHTSGLIGFLLLLCRCQVLIVQWNDSRGRTPKRYPNQSQQKRAIKGKGDSFEPLGALDLIETVAPDHVKTAWAECEQVGHEPSLTWFSAHSPPFPYQFHARTLPGPFCPNGLVPRGSHMSVAFE